jgi:hypothetical protein
VGDMWRSVLLGVILAGLLAGCSLGGGSGAARQGGRVGRLREHGPLTADVAARTSVTIRLLEITGGRVKVVRVQRLRCSPPNGSVADPAAACRALQDFVAHYHPDFRKARDRFCGRSANGTQIVEIFGKANGQRVGTSAISSPGKCRIGRRWMDDLRAITDSLISWGAVRG